MICICELNVYSGELSSEFPHEAFPASVGDTYHGIDDLLTAATNSGQLCSEYLREAFSTPLLKMRLQ